MGCSSVSEQARREIGFKLGVADPAVHGHWCYYRGGRAHSWMLLELVSGSGGLKR